MTRLVPPRHQARLLQRPRVDALIAAATEFPLTLMTAPAGSGKTMALAGFAARSNHPVAWCRMTAADDLTSLLYHLVAAFRVAGLIEHDKTCARIIYGEGKNKEKSEQKKAAQPHSPQAVLDLLVNELVAALTHETILVLDDYHQIDEQPELRALVERLIAIQPTQLHILFSSRYLPQLDPLPVVHARGEVYLIEQHDLAMSEEEIHELFALYECPSPSDVTRLITLCRGWPLILQMFAAQQHEQLRMDAAPMSQEALSPDAKPSSFSDPSYSCRHALTPPLVEYLTRQVLNEQPPEVQHFLLRSSGLRWFDKETCVALADILKVSHHTIPEIERRCLFVERVEPDHFVYQPLFKTFLEQQAKQHLAHWRELHLQIGDYYRWKGDEEGVIYHLMATREYGQVADFLEHFAPAWLRHGRAKTLLSWLDRLPEEYQHRPHLLEARAASYRQLGRFERALQTYEQAGQIFEQQNDREGQARTHRGRAEVYLDTVQPAPAETLLQQALDLLPEERLIERAEILLLQAENWANRGRVDIAFSLENQARQLAQQEQGEHDIEAPGTSLALSARLLLRSGRLNESRQILEAELGLDPQLAHVQRSATLAHREPLLLLALIYTMLGSGARALAMALRGLIEALQGGSKLTESIAHMRVGHAHQVMTPIGSESARDHYQQAMDLVENVGVVRTKVEGCMGLALLHGHSGDLVTAETVAQEGLDIAAASGDEWIAGLIWMALGGAAVAAGDERSTGWLDQAHQVFTNSDDHYGQAVVALWRAIWHLHTGSDEQVSQHVATLLELTKQHGYEGLLTVPTLFGPRDMAMLIPLLLRGRSLKDYQPFAQQLLRQSFPTIAADEMVEEYHPGYTLRIQMLGSFRVWRGANEIQAREWQREKARQLLQLLLTYRGQWLQREQICAWLWPDSDLDAAERQFKVTLNALNTALEPFRPPRTAPFFVRRQGLAYSFAPSYGCWIDVDEFELRTTTLPQNEPELALRNAQVAVDLYRGDYLAESLYDSWTLEERERLLARYLATATLVSNRLLARGETHQAVEMCERVLRRDRCYEEAYHVLIRAYARSGSRSQALRSYSRCVQALNDDLGIDPLPETTEIYEQVKRNEVV